MKRIAISFLWLFAVCTSVVAQKVTVEKENNSVVAIRIDGDPMNWILNTDGSQYAWVDNKYAWGKLLGLPNGISVRVERRQEGNDVEETYILYNVSDHDIALKDVAISTPFNDNYPDAQTCMTSRCNAHIWAGGEAAWVKCMRMSGRGPHLGLVVTEGAVDDYEVWERGQKKGMSNFRGVLALRLPQTVIKRGKSYRLSWLLFAHNGDDFGECVLQRDGVIVTSDKYVYEKGETAEVTFEYNFRTKTVKKKMDKLGETIVKTKIDGKTAMARLLCVSSADSLIARRVGFILNHQQMLNRQDPRYGAYMIYDNEGDSILTNHHGRSDLDEGRERTGMGIFLAEYYKTHPQPRLLESLKLYASFVHEKLQDKDYKTKSSLTKQSKNRGYNYAWVSDFFFRMYDITGNREYARHGYGTMMALFRMFGHNFYCIDYPVTEGLQALRHAGMVAEADTLLVHFRLTADQFCQNGLNFPKFEVNYEQSIVAPAVQFLSEMYIETKEARYLDCARLLMPPLEAFSGEQPDYHQNGIGIRHWDGYWFGKRQTYGDVYPHYWSAITAGAFHYYALATGQSDYQRKAENIVRGNLCLFREDGSATCAIVYPRCVNGQPAHYADAYANDQDFALMFYLLTMKKQ